MKFNNILLIALFSGIFSIPFLMYGFKKIRGMHIDEYLTIRHNNKVLSNIKRVDICKSTDRIIKDKKYELIRIYKINNNINILDMMNILLERNELILTQFIQYNDEKYVIFKIDGERLIKRKVKKEDKIYKDTTILAIKTKILNGCIKVSNIFRKKDKKKQIDNIHNKFIHRKTFDECKNEINIFKETDNISNIIRIDNEIFKEDKKQKDKTKDKKIDGVSVQKITIKDILKENSDICYEVNIFNKDNIVDLVKSHNRIIFIKNTGKVNIFLYGNESLKEDALKNMIDLKVIDKNTSFYNDLISFKCINRYNLYRKVENIDNLL